MKGRTYKIYVGASGSKFVANTKIGPVIEHCSRTSGCEVTRVYAGADATALVHSVGLHTQAEVIVLHAQGVPGYGPANPTDQSTHCERNDGVAYPNWPKRMWLPWWGCGMDLKIAEISNFIAEAAREHNMVTRTYPHSVGEAQHCNFRRAPVLPNIWKIRPLHHGSKGARVRFITRMLAKIPRPVISSLIAEFREPEGAPKRKAYLTEPSNTMTDRIVLAVKDFQRDHHQKQDGIIGVQTRAQIVAAYRYHKKRGTLV